MSQLNALSISDGARDLNCEDPRAFLERLLLFSFGPISLQRGSVYDRVFPEETRPWICFYSLDARAIETEEGW